MDNRYIKPAAVVVLLFAVSPYAFAYLSVMGAVYYQLTAWLIVWFWFIYSKQDVFTRGLLFLGASVLLATSGKLLLANKESPEILEMTYQLLLIIGGGVGSNFMASALLQKKPPSQTRQP